MDNEKVTSKSAPASFQPGFPTYSQGEAKLASEDDVINDNLGYINPNLHRRINEEGVKEDYEYLSPHYIISLQGTDSYRSTQHFIHDEDSEEREEP